MNKAQCPDPTSGGTTDDSYVKYRPKSRENAPFFTSDPKPVPPYTELPSS